MFLLTLRKAFVSIMKMNLFGKYAATCGTEHNDTQRKKRLTAAYSQALFVYHKIFSNNAIPPIIGK